VNTYNISTPNRVIINQITVNPQSLTTNQVNFDITNNDLNVNFETCYSKTDRSSGQQNVITNIQIAPDQVVPLFVDYQLSTFDKPGDSNQTCISWRSFTNGEYFKTNLAFVYDIRYTIEINGVPFFFNVRYELVRESPPETRVNVNINPDPPFTYNLQQCYYSDAEKKIPYTKFSSGNRMYIDLNLIPNTITPTCSDTNCYKHPLYDQYIKLLKANICAIDTVVVIPQDKKCDDINPATGVSYGKRYYLFDLTTNYYGGTFWQTELSPNSTCALKYMFSFIQRPLRSYSIQQFLEIEYFVSAGFKTTIFSDSSLEYIDPNSKKEENGEFLNQFRKISRINVDYSYYKNSSSSYVFYGLLSLLGGIIYVFSIVVLCYSLKTRFFNYKKE
jgi:hypothetical protein